MHNWKYYNHAAIPTCAPHEQPDTAPVKSGAIWNMPERPLLARWTTDFDCGYETNWWYVIKDTPFVPASLKAKRRYEINKGCRFFDVRRIDPAQYKEALYEVQVAAFSGWDEKYRPDVVHDDFIRRMEAWTRYRVYGGFHRETGKLCGYALVEVGDTCADFFVLRTVPQYERQAVNAAMVNGILTDLDSFLASGGYLCDGSRSVRHETAFQDYLEKYFGFRKAYCRLHIAFRPLIRPVVACLYPFRAVLRKLRSVGIISQVNGLLMMKEIAEKKVDP